MIVAELFGLLIFSFGFGFCASRLPTMRSNLSLSTPLMGRLYAQLHSVVGTGQVILFVRLWLRCFKADYYRFVIA
jgi:hypothetical protein